MRNAERARVLNSWARSRFTTLTFDGRLATVDLRSAIAQADAVLVSVPPDATGDPVLATCDEALTLAARLLNVKWTTHRILHSASVFPRGGVLQLGKMFQSR